MVLGLCMRWSQDRARGEIMAVYEKNPGFCTNWSQDCAREKPRIVRKVIPGLCTSLDHDCVWEKPRLVHEKKNLGLRTKWSQDCVTSWSYDSAREKPRIVHKLAPSLYYETVLGLCTSWVLGFVLESKVGEREKQEENKASPSIFSNLLQPSPPRLATCDIFFHVFLSFSDGLSAIPWPSLLNWLPSTYDLYHCDITLHTEPNSRFATVNPLLCGKLTSLIIST